MNKLKKFFNKKKKSIFSLALALVLALSFNYSPLALLADTFKTNAYKSTSVKNYYSNSSTTNETNIGTAEYPSSLKEYFEGSSNNFNIEQYYKTRYNDLLAGYVDEFLKASTLTETHETPGSNPDGEAYNTLYTEFLDSVKKDTLLEYYTQFASSIQNKDQGKTFQEYAEYFVSHEISYQKDGTGEKAIFPMFTYAKNSHEYKILFYNQLANKITGIVESVNPSVPVKNDKDELVGNFRDGVMDDADNAQFYLQSKSYKRVKEFIDNKIQETVAIYTYDRETQNKNVAGVIADKAPASMSYYYKDNTYESVTKTSYKYVTETGKTDPNVYYFGAEEPTIRDLADNKNITTMVYDESGSNKTNQQKYPLLYRPIESGEYGYINEDFITYYKYESIPYQTHSDGTYQVFVIDENGVITADEQATYDFMYFTTMTAEEFTAAGGASRFVNLPVPNGGDNDIYYTTISGITPSNDKEIERFNNFKEKFTDASGKSILYLKYKTTDNKTIYIDSTKKSQFETDNQNYAFKDDLIGIDAALLENEEYYKITNSSFSNYYVSETYDLYFKRVKQDYKELQSVEYETDKYVTQEVPNIPYEKMTIASNSYVNEDGTSDKKIYVFVPAGDVNTTSYTSINEQDLANAVHNEFVKIPDTIVEKLSLDKTFDYYYRHNLKVGVNKIYISVPDAKYDTEKDNEVYKNLNYTVIKSSEYNYTNYIAISKSDENYNENFKLYYKYVPASELSSNIYVKNEITKENALYVIDDSVTSSDKTTYKDAGRNFITMTTKEYEDNYRFFTQVSNIDSDGDGSTDDPNYNLKYTLYYKYNAKEQPEKVIYTYTSGKSDTYEPFYNTDTDYLASDYELIKSTDANYVEGTNLYYKKIRKANTEVYTYKPNITTFSYSTNSTLSFAANSYYAISFYVYTNGTYNTADTEDTLPMQASLYVIDSKNYIKDAKIEHISTNGTWQKHYLFIATDKLLTSSVKLSMFMGDKESILGSTKDHDTLTFTTATGSVLFDDIRVLKINETDFIKKSIDDEKVLTPEKDNDGNVIEPITKYVDEYKNEIFVKTIDENTTDKVDVFAGDGTNTFDKMYNFDNMTSYFSNISFANADSIDGFTLPTDLWQMYISRDVSGQGNNYLLKQYQSAYKDGKLSVSVIDEKSILDDKKPEEDEEDDAIDSSAPSDEDEDVKFIESTFKDDNKILKLQNTSRQLTLGLISNYFEVKQNEYYKLTVWIYSPDEDAKATLSVNSILKTAGTNVNGSLLTTTATIAANMSEHKDTQTNEYGWIPVSFFIEGNAFHAQKCYLTLCANKNNTVYFDNISIQKITSGAYDTANSDSETTTYCLSLTPSSSKLSTGVTNGTFDGITVSDNYNGTIDSTKPRTAESWTISKTSTGVVAGVVPTSSAYTAITENFFKKYNNNVVPSTSLNTNIYAINAPKTIKHPLNDADETDYEQKSIYSFYSTSITLSASSTYKISFDFAKGYEFTGAMFAKIYSSSVKPENLISTMKVSATDIADSDWNTYTYYVRTDSASSTIYIELGVENARGTCFFKNISSKTATKTINEIRDEMITDTDNSANTGADIFEKDSFKNVKFLELGAFDFSIHGNDRAPESNTYSADEFKNNLANTSTFTRGQTGLAVASYYTSSKTPSYTVTINKVEYYIKSFTEGSETVYKMFSDSNYKEEVTRLDGKLVTVDGFDKVIVGAEKPTEYDIVKTEKTNYVYNFENDVTLNNVFIDADELKNTHSENVLILANSYSTDYTLASPKYSTTLAKTSYYVLKVYAKTSSFDSDFGLNIDLDSSISRKWTNIDTTDAKYDNLRDENGFVCYQILLATNSSAISSFSIKFSLGTDKSTGSGYAIISGIELEKFATEKLFNEYATNYENVDKDSNDTVIKSYIGTITADTESTEETEEEPEEKESSTWATFFYIFSSLLLGIVLVMALVAIIIKKHPIKIVKQEQNDHDRDNSIAIESAKVRRSNRNKDDDSAVEIEDVVKKDDGFV